ncbi:MAG: amino acid--tRNA ligase-related protein, partial [Clostridia bacterium]
GLAYGLDRIVMLMLGLDNIRECIAFPKDKSARCIMTEAPSYVEDKQLDELAILVNEEILKREENIEN